MIVVDEHSREGSNGVNFLWMFVTQEPMADSRSDGSVGRV